MARTAKPREDMRWADWMERQARMNKFDQSAAKDLAFTYGLTDYGSVAGSMLEGGVPGDVSAGLIAQMPAYLRPGAAEYVSREAQDVHRKVRRSGLQGVDTTHLEALSTPEGALSALTDDPNVRMYQAYGPDAWKAGRGNGYGQMFGQFNMGRFA